MGQENNILPGTSSNFIIDLNSFAEEEVLVKLLNLSSEQLQKAIKKGQVFKNVGARTYAEHLQQYIRWLTDKQDIELFHEKLAIERAISTERSKKITKLQDEMLSPLAIANQQADLQLKKLKIESLALQNAEKRANTVLYNKLLEVTKPFAGFLLNSLNTLAQDFPQTREKVDETLDILYMLGANLIGKAQEGEEHYIRLLMDGENSDVV